MNEDIARQVMQEFGRQGGLARARSLTPEQRRELATLASKAAAKARTEAARNRRELFERDPETDVVRLKKEKAR